MASRNDVTGDELKSRAQSEAYANGYDRIWGKKKQTEQPGQTNTESEVVQPEAANDATS